MLVVLLRRYGYYWLLRLDDFCCYVFGDMVIILNVVYSCINLLYTDDLFMLLVILKDLLLKLVNNLILYRLNQRGAMRIIS